MQEQAERGQVKQIEVLLVEDDPNHAQMVCTVLGRAKGAMAVLRGLISVTPVDRLAAALELLARRQFDAVLLDLQLPDSQGIETLVKLRRASESVPVVVLTRFDDDGLALAAIRRGAQDYAAKDWLDGRLLRRTIRHAIERKRAEGELLRHTREVEAARTQIERQATELKARADQLDRINRELDEFAYIASHDLKEPLRGISGYCDILLESYHDKLDDQGRRRLAMLVDLCNRLETLIGDLLTYCRVGGARPARTGIDLAAVAAEAIDTLRPVIDRRRASVEVADRLPLVTGDATLIGMVLSNLISNSLKFNERPRPRIRIGCLPTDPPTLYVRDDGIGIEAKHHEAIFSIFRRLHGRKKYEGTGAGLTIVRKIVQSHGGRIRVESAPGAGATFYFTLAAPRQRPSAEVPPAAVQPEAKPADEPTLAAPHWVEQVCGMK